MPFIDPLPLRFTVLRRFDIDRGNGEVVAVFFTPVAPGAGGETAYRSNQDGLEGQPTRGAEPKAQGSVVSLRAWLHRGATHG